ncbi:MAG: enoyl-CoA hydratase/isomerase family protein [Thermoplasmata archaeon]|nr:enoyl-CoA hydratase/isomerase family protein [Thermoplasmata archaeon]MCI4354095.1 enoyl-CoA hydratase/isomerase family protein [Thermoplasmata archaeon]
MSAKAPGTIEVERVDGRATVTWERPPLNIFDIPMLSALTRSLRREEVVQANVVVLRGRGKCWSAGLAVEDHLKARLPAMFEAFRETLQTLWSLPAPTIAQVHGSCLGGGLELLMACDLAVASDRATFGQPEIRLGVFAPFGAAHYAKLMGPRHAAELLYLGTPIDAARAVAAGIINRAVPEEELAASVALAAQTFCGHRRETLRTLKRVLRASSSPPWSALEGAERTYREELMASESAEEGLRAFLEKRTPIWKDG